MKKKTQPRNGRGPTKRKTKTDICVEHANQGLTAREIAKITGYGLRSVASMLVCAKDRIKNRVYKTNPAKRTEKKATRSRVYFQHDKYAYAW